MPTTSMMLTIFRQTNVINFRFYHLVVKYSGGSRNRFVKTIWSLLLAVATEQSVSTLRDQYGQ